MGDFNKIRNMLADAWWNIAPEAKVNEALAALARLEAEQKRLEAREAVAIAALGIARARLGAKDGESLEDAAKRLRADSERLGKVRLLTQTMRAIGSDPVQGWARNLELILDGDP